MWNVYESLNQFCPIEKRMSKKKKEKKRECQPCHFKFSTVTLKVKRNKYN